MEVVQGSFDELGRPLSDTTFCVVDLETTGGSAAKGSKITEFGAVKIRGGEVVGEFQSLVNPDEAIPAYITVLTGITNQMVIGAPRIAEVLPSFLEFARGSVLVAHNAPFDVGFLKHFSRELGIPWPGFETLDTAILARRVLSREEVPNCKLATLAAKFSATTTPNHRALSDARATVDVLHGLFERLGPLGVTTLEEVSTYTAKVKPEQRRKRHLADHLPAAPGVYLFRDARDEILYVGTSRNLRVRTRSYFTKAETRTRMGEMVMLAQRIEGIVCATALEAQVRELRLIGKHRPPYNRRSRFPDRLSWLKLTREPWPRLSIVRKILDDDADYIGPFRGRAAAEGALTALHDSFRIRQCTPKLAKKSRISPCALAEMGHCLSPCDGSTDLETYAAEVAHVRNAMTGDPEELVTAIRSPHDRPRPHRAVRGRRDLAGPAHRIPPRCRPHPTAPRADRHRRTRRSGTTSRGLGDSRDPLRPARSRGRHAARHAPDRLGRRAPRDGRDGRARLRSHPCCDGRGDRDAAALARLPRPAHGPRLVAHPARRRRTPSLPVRGRQRVVAGTPAARLG